MGRRYAAFWLFGLLGLAGCAEMKPLFLPEGKPELSLWQRRQQQLRQLQRWDIQGRVAIETAQDNWTASVTWKNEAEHYQMRFMAPLSQGTFELTGAPDRVQLRMPDKTLEAPDPSQLMQENLGWSLPVYGMRYWVLGLPAPGRKTQELRVDEAGHLVDLQQDGWRISVLRYQKVGGLELPEKIYMQNDPVKVRLVVGEWQLH
ncbi:MAG TPA: lipoprotein insertase outer membrane protein LolB [Gammaproteobacteria bacterium]|nr:lipoprotein insertase outer membrane protein LolB [Gammaproteobacteria bacterium]